MDIEGGGDGKVFFVFFSDPVKYDELLELIYWIVDNIYVLPHDNGYDWGIWKF
jgi:hypothetical protein